MVTDRKVQRALRALEDLRRGYHLYSEVPAEDLRALRGALLGMLQLVGATQDLREAEAAR